ncbi:uncharacterized protein LOC133821328 [Humulus lupulus]|uniref:uncharacterized protein LOC133821328 n=1 Tax=Humulus lupulus TaxID=3486 RepID=UPI002B40D2C9|nr:uncharacterized protein LOC133821328 [Humulus lupulus]
MFVDTAPEVEALMDTTLEVEAPINTSTLPETPTPSLSIHPEPLKKDVKCKLYVGQGGDVVALRRVVATKGNVHGKILAPGNYREVIDKCLDGSAKLPVSVRDETTLVVHAVNSFVAWPSHLIISYDHEQEPKRLKRKRISAACLPTQDLKHPQQQLPTTQEEVGSSMASKLPIIFKVSIGLPMFLKILLGSVKYVEPGFMIDILMETNIMGEQYTLYISDEDIVHFGLMEEISASCISFYIRRHWMLVIIDPDDDTCYYLDPLRKSPPNDLKNLMNSVSSHIKRKTGRNEKKIQVENSQFPSSNIFSRVRLLYHKDDEGLLLE